MRKIVETGFTVIAPHTAAAHTAKRKVGIGKLDDGVIYAAAAKGDFIDDFLIVFRLVGKDIERQWLWVWIKVGYHFGQIFKFQNR